jgi:tetrahydromethanopterin S-methyltransferase subunit G
MANDPTKKAASFLASLRGGARGAVGGGAAGGGPPPEELVRPLQRRVDELEKRVQDVLKAAAGPEEGEAPRAPTELMMYIHARTELLERKLQEAQAEALRANLLLHERETAQRQAQKEVEELFRTIKEHERSARYDAALRDQLCAAQQRLAELEQKVEGGQAAPGAAPAPPDPALRAAAAGGGVDSMALLVLTAKLADLERELEAARRERDSERARRTKWERETAATFSQAHWKKPTGVELTVEAALETMALALREREEAEGELKEALAQAQARPPESPSDPVLRARITGAQERLDRLSRTLDQQLHLVQAWIAGNK